MSKPNNKFDLYFHTALRNVGLYTSLSFATLVYSRVYRGSTPMYDITLISISMIFLLLSASINYILNNDITQHLEQIKNSNKETSKENIYLRITQIVFTIHGVLFLLGSGTLIRLYILK